MELTPEQYETVEKLSGHGYTVYQIAMYFKIKVHFLYDEYYKEDSQFRFHYDRGLLIKEVERDIALCDSAKNGNAVAAMTADKRVRERKIQLFKEHLLAGH